MNKEVKRVVRNVLLVTGSVGAAFGVGGCLVTKDDMNKAVADALATSDARNATLVAQALQNGTVSTPDRGPAQFATSVDVPTRISVESTRVPRPVEVTKEIPRTAEGLFKAINAACPESVQGAENLRVSEIVPEFNDQNVQVGWRITRERSQNIGEGNFIPPFCVKLPESWPMAFGFLHYEAQRNLLGLTPTEATIANLNQDAVGAGVPTGAVLAAEGVTIYYSDTNNYGRLRYSTVQDRLTRRQ